MSRFHGLVFGLIDKKETFYGQKLQYRDLETWDGVYVGLRPESSPPLWSLLNDAIYQTVVFLMTVPLI